MIPKGPSLASSFVKLALFNISPEVVRKNCSLPPSARVCADHMPADFVPSHFDLRQRSGVASRSEGKGSVSVGGEWSMKNFVAGEKY
jgi:hypothetical protein